MRIQLKNISCCEWIYLLPSIKFHIKGWREGIGIFKSLFPKNKKGFQILIHWLWFEIFIETSEKNIFYGKN
jgi:hypothetical protein